MVAGGGNNREIVRQLFISETTVKTHLPLRQVRGP